jgi:hypothetical protein
MRPLCTCAVALLLLSAMACRKAASPDARSAPVQRSGVAGNEHDVRSTLAGAASAAGAERPAGAPIAERALLDPGRDLGLAVAQTTKEQALLIVAKALRDRADLSGAVGVASLALYCDCEPETALKKLSPNAEYAERLRVMVNTISVAMHEERRSLVEGRALKAVPLAIALVIRRLDEKPEERVPPDCQHYQLRCDEAATEKADTDLAISVTIIWDGYPAPNTLNRFEATVSIPFLVFPRRPRSNDDPSQTWRVETRTLRFVLKEGKWMKD